MATDCESGGPPIDRGWAWVILIGFGMANFICLGFYKSFGIFFVEIQETFGTSASVTSLMSSLHSGVFSVAGLAVMMVGLTFISSRQALFLAGITAGGGFLLIGFAPNIEVVIIAYGVICGIGFSFAFGPSTALCGKYFEKKRGTAMSLGKTIGGVGGLLYPVLLRSLLDAYTVRGAAIVVAGIMLNLVVCGSLFRPLEFYSKRKTVSAEVETLDPDNVPQKASRCNGYSNEFASTGSCDCVHKRESDLTNHESKTNTCKSVAVYATSNVTDIKPVSFNNVTSPLLDTTMDEDFRRRTLSESFRPAVSATTKSSSASMSNIYKYVSSCDDIGVSVTNIYHDQVESSNRFTDKLQKTSAAQPSGTTSCGKCSNIVDCSILSNLLFRLLFCVGFLALPGSILLSVFLPPHLKDIGIDKKKTIIILSVSAVADILGRLSCGIIADRRWLKSHQLIQIALVVSGICLNATLVSSSFEYWIVFAFVHGLMAGVYPVVFVVTLVEFVGLRNLTNGLGILVLCHGMTMGINSYVTGTIRDLTGNYFVPFHILGLLQLLGAAILFLEPVIRRYQERKEQTNNTESVA